MSHAREVRQCYKKLWKTLNQLFGEDLEALHLTRKRTREEFRKNIHLTNEDEIKKSLQIGFDTIKILTRTVIPAKLNERGNYEAKIRTENIDGPCLPEEENSCKISSQKTTQHKSDTNN